MQTYRSRTAGYATLFRIKYGRQTYDFQERTLIFLAPDQVIEPFSAPSDLLKKETGKSTQEPINRVAASLGFEYPQHFSKLFKNKTGVSPAQYRR